MNARRWEFLVAAVEAVCAVAAAAYLVTLGLTAGAPDRTPLDRGFPFALAAVVLVVLGVMAARSLRRARAIPVAPPAPRRRRRRSPPSCRPRDAASSHVSSTSSPEPACSRRACPTPPTCRRPSPTRASR